MSYVKLLGLSTLSCGCVVGRYHETPVERDVTYVEQKGDGCDDPKHRRNHRIRPKTLSREQSGPDLARVV